MEHARSARVTRGQRPAGRGRRLRGHSAAPTLALSGCARGEAAQLALPGSPGEALAQLAVLAGDEDREIIILGGRAPQEAQLLLSVPQGLALSRELCL